MNNWQNYLISKDIRPSQQRIAIMDYLDCHRTHPTADEIFSGLNASMPTLSKTTIYNTLKVLVDKGAIRMISIDDKNARFDAETSNHAHFMCTSCGSILDIPLFDTAIEHTIQNSPLLKDYLIHDTQIFHKGICPICKNNLNNNKS